jgi:hypothetical protein
MALKRKRHSLVYLRGGRGNPPSLFATRARPPGPPLGGRLSQPPRTSSGVDWKADGSRGRSPSSGGIPWRAAGPSRRARRQAQTQHPAARVDARPPAGPRPIVNHAFAPTQTARADGARGTSQAVHHRVSHRMHKRPASSARQRTGSRRVARCMGLCRPLARWTLRNPAGPRASVLRAGLMAAPSPWTLGHLLEAARREGDWRCRHLAGGFLGYTAARTRVLRCQMGIRAEQSRASWLGFPGG